MTEQTNKKPNKPLCAGLLAHVDAGKTTLSEQILMHTGRIRSLGRVDHGSAFMDNEALERQRGITIFSEQASMSLGDHTRIVLIDTPGHEDFAAQRLRALLVMDVCILVVSCADRIQSGTKTVYNEAKAAGIPVVFFLNKADQPGAHPAETLAALRQELKAEILPAMWQNDAGREEIAIQDEALLDLHLSGAADDAMYLEKLRQLLKDGTVSVYLSGSALLGEGVDELLRVLSELFGERMTGDADQPFSGIVYRVRRINGQRLSYVRILSGTLAPRQEVNTVRGPEKIHAMYEAQGQRLNNVDSASAGDIVAMTGIFAIPGERIGSDPEPAEVPEPMMVQALTPVPPLTGQRLLQDLRELEEEEPELAVTPTETSVEVSLMGKTQQEVLGQILEDRFGDRVTAGEPRIQYRETIAAPVTGIGHYEPLRHYAEAWLRLVPGLPGSGITFESRCAPNSLDENWQRLIRTHVFERIHPGVLTGSPITDIRIILIGGRSHLKHTEGGDFREATCRAIRQGLMQAENVLLEPFVAFELTMPFEVSAKVTGDLIGMDAQMEIPEHLDSGDVIQRGTCRLAAIYAYPERFASLTHGYGRFSMHFHGYYPCKQQEAVVKATGYSPTTDAEHPCNSVFCSHGAGFPVSWDHVREWAHLTKDMEGYEDAFDSVG